MAEKETSANPMKDLWALIFFLVILGILWAYTGGPSRPAATSGPFLEKPQEKRMEELQKQTEEIVSEKKESITEIINSSASKYKGMATLRTSSARKDDPQKEYIEITASSKNEKPLAISGWTLEGKTGLDIKIGKGAYLPRSAQINPQETIYLNPGGKAIIITGKSPIGTSFRLNLCTGYFGQFQDFYPRLPKKCPYPEDENLPSNLKDECLNYIEDLLRCEIQIKAVPYTLGESCSNYINQKINYKTCVEAHKNDADFYKDEWRIYLGRSDELWKQKRETITLKDEYGKIIDQKSY